MEIKEAMEILEKDIHTEVPKAAISVRKHDAAVRMALVALEKQIPVKPIILDQLNGDIDYECPMCGKRVMSDAESRNNYCGECGCKFDWSEIDETDWCGWIPTTERLPDQREFIESYVRSAYAAEFLVTIEGADKATTLYYSQTGVWFDEQGEPYKVVAWMPLPERYKG